MKEITDLKRLAKTKIGVYSDGLGIISANFKITLSPTRREMKNLLQFLENNSGF